MIIWRSQVQSWLCSIFVHSIRQQSPCGPVPVLGFRTSPSSDWSEPSPRGVRIKCSDSTRSPSSVHRCPCQIGTSQSVRTDTRTPQKLAWTPSDSMAFRIGMVRNTWGRVKTSKNNYNDDKENRAKKNSTKAKRMRDVCLIYQWSNILWKITDQYLTEASIGQLNQHSCDRN